MIEYIVIFVFLTILVSIQLTLNNMLVILKDISNKLKFYRKEDDYDQQKREDTI